MLYLGHTSGWGPGRIFSHYENTFDEDLSRFRTKLQPERDAAADVIILILLIISTTQHLPSKDFVLNFSNINQVNLHSSCLNGCCHYPCCKDQVTGTQCRLGFAHVCSASKWWEVTLLISLQKLLTCPLCPPLCEQPRGGCRSVLGLPKQSATNWAA